MSASRSEPPFVVVGAGLSGLYAALLLARRGHRPRVIDRAPRAGGLASAETFRGIPCDLGSHRLHPEALEHPLFREIAEREPFLVRPRRGLLLLGDSRVPYPPTAMGLAQALGLRASASAGAAWLGRRLRRRAGWDDARARLGEGDAGFEAFVVSRVGRAAYRAFYAPYAEKVWGVPPCELSQTVAKSRVSTTEPQRLLSAAGGLATSLVRRSRRQPEPFVYPARGIASIVGFLEQRLAELGIRVEHGRAFEPSDARGARVLFAGDLRDLVPTSLEHRGLYLVYLAYPVPRLGEIETYYSPHPSHWFGRVSELQNYSPTLRREGETVLCVEIPEGRWGRGLDFASGPRLAELLAQLVRAGIVPPGLAALEARQRFVPNVYPLYRRGWLTEWRATMARVAKLGTVLPFGRQALFLHCNLDHCADLAADAVRHVSDGGDAASWIGTAEGRLEVRVRD